MKDTPANPPSLRRGAPRTVDCRLSTVDSALRAAPLRVGARDSALSLIQAEGALKHLRESSGLDFQLLPFSSPGDRDQRADLRTAPGDFFTRDLDDALLAGALDLAIHSAKDLPPEGLRPGLDWFWLPWREEPRDCVVARAGVDLAAEGLRIGVSSARREAWARQRFPGAALLSLRGAIPERLAKLDRGEYDAILVAAAALHRLNLAERITELIPLTDLTPPPGQGVLAVTFRRDDARVRALRGLYLKAVRFVGAGVGAAELCTVAGARELQHADCVIYDALMDVSLVDGLRAERLYVGKRAGAHAMRQPEITRLIGERVRRGERVVRLKGGDPGLFGRLAEEVEALAADGLPFRVWPGISALMAATTATGMLLTRRGESKGFRVETPRSQGEETPMVYFMALGALAQVAAAHPPQTPAAIVYDAGGPAQEIVRGSVGELVARAADPRPGLVIVGPAAERAFPALGPLAGRRIWVTGSPSVAEKAREAVFDLGGTPIVRPLIRFEAVATYKIRPSKAYTHLVVTSPTAARFLLEQMRSPIQYLPKRLIVTGPATAEALAHLRIDTLVPEGDFSARGLLAALPEDLTGARILRIRSEEAGPALAEALRARGAKVKDLPLYRTVPVAGVEPPPCEAVFLASASAAKAYLALAATLPGPAPDLLCMGEPTARVLRAAGLEPRAVAACQTVDEALLTYARSLL